MLSLNLAWINTSALDIAAGPPPKLPAIEWLGVSKAPLR